MGPERKTKELKYGKERNGFYAVPGKNSLHPYPGNSKMGDEGLIPMLSPCTVEWRVKCDLV